MGIQINGQLVESEEKIGEAIALAVGNLITAGSEKAARGVLLPPGGKVKIEGELAFSFEAALPTSTGTDTVQNFKVDPWAVVAAISRRAGLEEKKIAMLLDEAKGLQDASDKDIKNIADAFNAAALERFGVSQVPKSPRLKVVRREVRAL